MLQVGKLRNTLFGDSGELRRKDARVGVARDIGAADGRGQYCNGLNI
jgi:hypothetical protein